MARGQSDKGCAFIDRTNPTVFVVDDNKKDLETLHLLLDSDRLNAEFYTSAEAFLATYTLNRPGCLVSEVRLPQMDGLALQQTLAAKQFKIPVIFLVAQPDLTTAVEAIKTGALDFIPKWSYNRKLLNRIHEAIAFDQRSRRDDRKDPDSSTALSLLTPREQEVAALLVAGQSNKQIAKRLKLSPGTVEGHRAHLMHKMGAKSLAQLVKIVGTSGVFENTRSCATDISPPMPITTKNTEDMTEQSVFSGKSVKFENDADAQVSENNALGGRMNLKCGHDSAYAQIERALEEEQFRLYCQPIISLTSGRDDVIRYELLLRLLNRSGDILLPSFLLATAERCGLMTFIDRWVIKTALRHATEPPCGSMNVELGINLSRNALYDNSLLSFIREELAVTDLSPRQLCFDIAEATAFTNRASAQQFITQIKQIGCSVALDNVGGGMAPLTFLQEIPVDYIKIDGCLTRDMTQNPVNRAMVEAINHVAHAMGIRPVAGHTETEALTQQLDYCGIDYAQGNIFGSPKALTEKACACPSDNLQ